MAIQVTWFNETDESGAPSYDAQALRNLMTAVFTAPSDDPGGTRSAVRYTDGDDLETYTTGTYEVRVRPGMAVIAADVIGQGAYVFRTDATESLTLPSADPTNSRIDVVYAQVQDDDIDGGGTKGGVIGFVEGLPSAVPSPAAIPQNALKLAEVVVPPAGGALQVRDSREWLAGPGGIVRTTSQMRASLQVPTGTLAYESDTGRWMGKNEAGQWGSIFDPQVQWTNLTGLNGNYQWDAGKQGQWRRNGDMVYLRGAIERTSGNVNVNDGVQLFVLPANARPTRNMTFAVAGDQALTGAPTLRVDVRTDGTGVLRGATTQNDKAQWVAFDGITFYVN